MALTPHDIALLLTERGQKQYGREAVSQLDHALQCAHLAEGAGETPATVVAALLHDLGHLLAPAAAENEARAPRQDDLHQYAALPFLHGVLPDAVLEPIRMHVDAKRYLCAVDAGYWATLSPASQHSLGLQGGAYGAVEADRFASQPFAHEAIRLRRYDDLAKVPGRATPPLPHYLALLERVSSQA
ncbi:phosphonate degradation operons associated HDIG domain protein [Acidovorax sp. CF316]|uniref:phosphonate degradation HD-domain oxygenase n=1 Tax=Acidovorax sp. CF316 TaxID=1144317 RepID=UPI00026BC848|nr:phosphonate degradation HD-domain oxygenase [Acidovorax sp. CF316]EJE48439.1 phosphonate degradation operons associated HDIG domain protein [Acidovorax sp. CF316]